MNKVLTLSVITGLVIIGGLVSYPLIAGAQTAQNQHNFNNKGYGNGLEIKAEAMNMTVDQLKDQLQTKTIQQIALEKGMTTDQYKEKIREISKSHWKEIGLSDEEIQERTQKQQDRQANCDGSGLNQNKYGLSNKR
ncbi:MAG TPA: hypothetical protein PLO25_01020 [Candidatus Saccharibacteria bacterium]|nr:hypothetical protein [Candidatus Saccharibacteria bacterium]